MTDERVARSVALEQAYVYDVYEQFYDNPNSKSWPKVQQFLNGLEPGSLICDVGCGNGKYLNINTSLYNIGGDKSMRLTELAREKQNEVIVLDNLALPFRDDSLDAVISIAVIHHLATNERRICALRELARVLRIGGKLIISVWAMEQSNRKFESQDVLIPWHKNNLNTSEDALHLYTQPDPEKLKVIRKKGRHKSPSTTLASPNETCYSFVRRALQKLAGGRRVGIHRPWFLDSWSCTKEIHTNQEDVNIQDLPIELRRIDEDDGVQRRQTLPTSSQTVVNLTNKSKSMSNIKTEEQRIKPKLVKQKKSICDEDEPLTLPDFKPNRRGNVLKQRSLNEEIMSADRLKEKEMLRKNIHKQASLNEDLINQRRTFDAFKDSFFSVSTSKRFQLIKTGFSNKIKNSNIDKVTLKNGFVRMFQNWKSDNTIPENESIDCLESKEEISERRHSKEDGSDSSKDSSLQSDTSVDSEDSFASVIFIPKSNPMSPTLSQNDPTSPRLLKNPCSNIKQSSCPTSPKIKQMPLTVYPLIKQFSSPKPSTDMFVERDQITASTVVKKPLAKYTVQQIPAFKKTNLNTPNDGLIKDLLCKKTKKYPIVRHSSVTNGQVEAVAKPLPKMLTLELFNPEIDDKDSDSSCVSSPDSIGSVINVQKFQFPDLKPTKKFHLIKQRSLTTDQMFESPWNEDCHKHLTDFADTLSEKLLQEIDNYQKQSTEDQINDPYISRLSEELDDLSKLSDEIQKQNEYLAKLSISDELLNKQCRKCAKQIDHCKCLNKLSDFKSVQLGDNEEDSKKIHSNDDSIVVDNKCKFSDRQSSSINNNINKLSISKTFIRTNNSTDSCDSEKGSTTNSITSSIATSINCEHSMESDKYSNESKDTLSRCSDGGSTASLASCPDWKTFKNDTKLNKDNSSNSVSSKTKDKISLLSDTSQDSLPSDNVGGEITYHRYYHVFKEGELDQLIEKYVENLHIISSYYDHASWCIIAEKVQVWTI